MEPLTQILMDAGTDPVAWLTQAGPVGILAFIVVAFLKGWIVPGSQLDRARQERDRALDLVYKQAGLANRAVDITASRLEFEQGILELRRKEGGRDEPLGPV